MVLYSALIRAQILISFTRLYLRFCWPVTMYTISNITNGYRVGMFPFIPGVRPVFYLPIIVRGRLRVTDWACSISFTELAIAAQVRFPLVAVGFWTMPASHGAFLFTGRRVREFCPYRYGPLKAYDGCHKMAQSVRSEFLSLSLSFSLFLSFSLSLFLSFSLSLSLSLSDFIDNKGQLT